MRRALPWDDDDWAKLTGTHSEPVAAGVTADEDTAFNYSVYWAGIQLIAGTMASLPLPTYKRSPGGDRKPASEHPLYDLLHHCPNPEMTSYTFRETLQEKIFTWGNGYAGIVRKRRGGHPTALWPINPSRIELKRTKTGRLYYEFMPLGASRPTVLRPDQVFHVRNISRNGLVGRSLISAARESLGLGLALERFEGNFYGKAAVPSGALEIPEELSKKGRDALAQSLRDEHVDWENKRRPMILEGGTKWHSISVPQKDAMTMELRRYTVEEWARWFNMPVSFLREMTNSAVRANIEEESLNIVLYTFRPWAVRWEQEFQRQLFLEEDADKYFAEFNFDGLLRGNAMTQAEVFAKAHQNGQMTINEIRQLKNMNSIGPDGDRHYVAINMVPVDKVDEVLDPDPVPKAVPNPAQAKEPVKEEEKGKRSAAKPVSTLPVRMRVIVPHMALFVDAMLRTVNKEVKAGKAAIRKHIKVGREEDFVAWMDDFYAKQIEEIRTNIHPAVDNLASQLWVAVTPLVGMGGEDELGNLAIFARDYALGAGKRHSGYSRNQLEKIIREADGAELQDALEARLVEWGKSRPNVAAQRELHQAGNALSLEIFRLLGVREKIWVTECASDSPCAALSGRIVPVSDPFVRKGEIIEMAGGEQFTIRKDRLHPPLDTDCVCQIEAVRSWYNGDS